VLFARLWKLHSSQEAAQHATVIPMWQSPFGAQTYLIPALLLLGVMGVLVLLIVCANVSNLVLARGVSRRGEIAARLALGASRGRVLRLLFIESLTLAIPGALAGALCSEGLMWLMNNVSPGTGAAPGRTFFDVSIDGVVGGFALLLSCGCALVFGLLPALRISRVDLASVMRDDLSPRTASSARMRNLLVVSQVAVSLVLLVGAGSCCAVSSRRALRIPASMFETSRRSRSTFNRADTTRPAVIRSMRTCSTRFAPSPEWNRRHSQTTRRCRWSLDVRWSSRSKDTHRKRTRI
jgi:hypothetical protein